MRAYETIKLEQYPDLADIKADGRKSSVGCLPGRCGQFRSHFKNKQARDQTRRHLKRRDRRQALRFLEMTG